MGVPEGIRAPLGSPDPQRQVISSTSWVLSCSETHVGDVASAGQQIYTGCPRSGPRVVTGET